MLKNFKLGTKVLFPALNGVLGLIIVIGFTLYSLSKIGDEIYEIDHHLIPINNTLVELEKDILKEEILAYQLVVASKDINSSEYKYTKEKLHKLEKSTDKVIVEAKDIIKKAIENSKYDQLKDKYQYFLNGIMELESNQKKFEVTIKHFEKSLENAKMIEVNNDLKIIKNELTMMESKIIKMIDEMKVFLQKTIALTDEHEHSLENALMILSIIAIVIVILLSTYISRDIRNSIESFQLTLNEFFLYLNKEINTINITQNNSKDEIGQMTQNVNKNILKIQDNMQKDLGAIGEIMSFSEKMSDGQFSARIILKASDNRMNHAINALNNFAEQLQKNTDNIVSVLEEYKEYDYTKRVDINGLEGYLKRIAESTNIVGDSITSMLISNKKSGLTLENSSNTLLTNVDILNSNSNKTAASLEETAAALEEMTSNIRQNTQSVSKMSNYANELTKSAQEGQVQATNTTNAMDEINQQVTSINEAITVIDQIAFQTNILSLNAAVEAATAGEAGKGFAVVAQEVRNLAARSAEAAKEIKELVEEANIKANEGKNISDSMIKGYSVLTENISNTMELIRSVDSASKEQATGIEQINDAINQLDQQTQQNVGISNEAHNIAISTDKISKQIVADANTKEFIGKNDL